MSYGRLGLDEAQRAAAGSRAPTFAVVLFSMFVTGLTLRIFLVDVIVNQLWPYTSEGGAFLGKIHPGSYLMFAAAGLLYISPGYRFAVQDLPLVRALIVFAVGSVICAVIPMMQGRNGPAGYVIDVYLVVVAACCFLLSMPPAWRQRTLYIVLGGLCLNTFVAIGEFATGRFVLPIESAEFRPTGFLGAALNVGVIHLTAVLILISLPIRWPWKYGVSGLLMMGLLISASRTAMLVAVAVIPLAILVTARLRNEGVSVGVAAALMGLFAVTVFPLLIFGVSELGFLDRFKGGYIDDSAQTRIDIYRVFEFVGWRDIILGTDILLIRKIAQELLGIGLIESALVFFVFDFGLIGTIIFGLMLLFLLWRIAANSHPVTGLAMLVFLVLALTNNTLSTKVPSAIVALVLGVASGAFYQRRGSP